MTATRSSGQTSRSNMLFTLDDRQDGRKRVLRRFSRRIVDFLLINVYAGENHLGNVEKLHQVSAQSVNRAFASLRKAFSKSDKSSTMNVGSNDVDELPSLCDGWLAVNEKLPPSALLSKYLEDHQLISENSLCKRMMKIASIKPIVFSADRSLPIDRFRSGNEHRLDLLEITDLLAKLKMYLSRRCRRLEASSRSGKRSSIGSQTSSSILCDKAIQCSQSVEFLKVSPELKFFSRSSLLMTVESDEKCSAADKQRRNSSTSLEYVAKYRPEFPRNLRSLSSSAMFKPQNRRRASDRLTDTIRQADSEFLRYSNFIEDDLVSIHRRRCRRRHRHPKKTGKSRHEEVLATKKVLLEDYITEVKEIIHSESRRIEEQREARILESVKSRMDRDLPMHTDSWYSLEDNRPRGLSSCTSYETARCCCCCLGEGDRLPTSCEALVLCAGCSLSARKRIARVDSCKSAKSSRSVDSGVLLDHLTSDDKGQRDEMNTSCNDELLCQRVENAVRKFTEELILCERRTRDRSRSTRRRLRRHRRSRSRTASTTTSTTTDRDQSGTSGLNYPRNSSYEDEENIAGISTPSLVSLSDSEELAS